MVDYNELVLGGGNGLSLAHSDPIVLEFDRLQNQLKGALPPSLFLAGSQARPFSFRFSAKGYVLNWFLEIGSFSFLSLVIKKT